MPNLINWKEKEHFSNTFHLNNAKQRTSEIHQDSIITSASDFYKRGSLVKILFGSHYRDVWSKRISYEVLNKLDTLKFHKVGGGMQTTSIEVRANDDRSYSLRTLDKDQAKVLPTLLYPSALRLLLRDQTSALNPYNSVVVASLSESLNFYHTSPKIVYVPYSSDYHDSINFYLAGRAVVFEEEPGSKWKNKMRFEEPLDIINSEELLDLLHSRNQSISFDTTGYLRCRLFDLLISDWDRHTNQWKWVLQKDSSTTYIRPFPIDRDMAFCLFDDGLVNQLVISVTNKFKSFRPGNSIFDAAKKTTSFDSLFLKNLTASKFKSAADYTQQNLSDSSINKAFHKYPEDIFKLIGEKHIMTLQSRLSVLDSASLLFKRHIDDM